MSVAGALLGRPECLGPRAMLSQTGRRWVVGGDLSCTLEYTMFLWRVVPFTPRYKLVGVP